MTTHRNGFDLETELLPRIAKGSGWEAVEPMTLGAAVNTTCLGGEMTVRAGYLTLPGTTRRVWARFFLQTRQMGGFTGEAIVFAYGESQYLPNPALVEAVAIEAQVWVAASTTHNEGMLRNAVDALKAAKPVYTPNPTAWRVYACQHAVVEGENARPSRGWYPASCSKCGMDLSVDSGD